MNESMVSKVNAIRKVLAFTGCRSDYDLLSRLFKLLSCDSEFDFKLLVSGAHLSRDHGYTVKEIEKDDLSILARVESIPLKNSDHVRIDSAANLFSGAITAVADWSPDLILFGGDREDVIVAALLGAYLGIPTAHFFGGDHASDGHVDHLVRHATSKLASVHFVSTSKHRQRLLALGEDQRRVFEIGSPALDKFVLELQKTREDLFRSIGVPPVELYAVLVYHPIDEDGLSSEECFENILEALAEENIFTFIGEPNIDHGHEQIKQVIERCSKRPNVHYYCNLSRIDFINLLRNSALLIGNSSIGIVESAMIPLGVVNVGNRQRGRACGENVRFVGGDISSIRNAIREVRSSDFANSLKGTKSLYGDGKSSEKAHAILRSLNFQDFIPKTDDPLSVNSTEVL